MPCFGTYEAGVSLEALLQDGSCGNPEFPDLNAMRSLIFCCVFKPEELPKAPAVVRIGVRDAHGIEEIATDFLQVLAKLGRQVASRVLVIVVTAHRGVVDENLATVGQIEPKSRRVSALPSGKKLMYAVIVWISSRMGSKSSFAAPGIVSGSHDISQLGGGHSSFKGVASHYASHTVAGGKESHEMMELRPLNPTPTPEVPLPRAPLERVIAQVRFPPILTIRDPDKVAVVQEALRETYPNLSQEQVHSIEAHGGQAPSISQGLIWRLADRERDPHWRVSLGVDFVALETSSYDSRSDFLERLRTVLAAVEHGFRPATASRLGLRYIDRLTDEAVDQVADLVCPDVLGIVKPARNPHAALGESVVHLMTEVQFLAQSEARVQGRWGLLPANATYDPDALEPVGKRSWVLDLDMFTTESQTFESEELLTTATDFAKGLYWLFRQMVTDEFLRHYGGNP